MKIQAAGWLLTPARPRRPAPGPGSSTALASGLGSNPVGLDRGMLGRDHVVTFDRSGPLVLLTAHNTSYRAQTENAAEQRAVADSFAPSVLWGFELAATADPDGRVLVDATDFLLRDALGVTERLRSSEQGTFALDTARSALFASGARAFPDNVELEATVTFTSTQPGELVAATAAVPEVVTLRQHHASSACPMVTGRGSPTRASATAR